MNDLIKVGYTGKPHGFKGELKVKIEGKFIADFVQSEVIFINIEGQKIPYFIEDILVENQLLLKLEDYNTKEVAAQLSGKEVYLRQSDIKSDISESPLAYSTMTGFTLQDIEKGVIGTIIKIVEYPLQEMAVVNYRGKELLIPLNPQFVEKIDKKQKCVMMNLPEGLLDLE